MWCVLTCLTAFLIVLLDIFFTFGAKWIKHRGAIISVVVFASCNAAFSAIVYFTFHNNEALSAYPYWLRAILLGVAYVGIIRTKLSSIKRSDGSDIPIGLEVAYENLKAICYKNINDLIIRVQYEEARKLANEKSLLELTMEAKFAIEADKFLSPEEKTQRKDWLRGVISSPDKTEASLLLAHFVNSRESISKFG
jgi:hypothetical protein